MLCELSGDCPQIDTGVCAQQTRYPFRVRQRASSARPARRTSRARACSLGSARAYPLAKARLSATASASRAESTAATDSAKSSSVANLLSRTSAAASPSAASSSPAVGSAMPPRYERPASYICGILSHSLSTLAPVPSDGPDLSLDELARLHVLRGPQLMWLLGAGASAAAGVPTAGQMIDEFRCLIYSTLEGVPLAALNLAEPAVRERIERHFTAHAGYPSPGDPGEYSALFEAAWPAAADRRAYIDSKVAVGRPTYDNFGLAMLLAIGRGRVVWTTTSTG